MRNLHPRRDDLVPREEAIQLLEPYFEPILAPFFEAFEVWQEFERSLPWVRAPLSSAAQAHFLNCQIVHRAKIRFEAFPEVRPFEECGFYCLAFQKRILLHFKKFDRDGFPRNIRTFQQEQLAYQAQLDLPGIPPMATWVTAGYQLSPAADAIIAVFVLCTYADRQLWSIPLFNADAGEPPLFPSVVPSPPRPAPTASPAAEEPQRKSKVRAKRRRTS